MERKMEVVESGRGEADLRALCGSGRRKHIWAPDSLHMQAICANKALRLFRLPSRASSLRKHCCAFLALPVGGSAVRDLPTAVCLLSVERRKSLPIHGSREDRTGAST